MTKAYLALGSNLNHPSKQLIHALKSINQIPKTVIIQSSNAYQTQSIGKKTQPNYINMVIVINTKLPPLSLLKYCQRIESNQQRIRKYKWGPRTLDIDILFYGKLNLKLKKLSIPHPEIFNRDFVMGPLCDVTSSHPINESILNKPKHVLKKHFY